MPIVIYLHGNSGSRLEGLCTLNWLVPNINLFCFDFSGSGKSEGDYVTMGLYESQDLEEVVNYCSNILKSSKIILWGRSMGAVTAILYSSRFPSKIQCIILDSPFSNLY